MFYGLSKNKNGKEIPDFDRYKPWYNDEFSGKISYTLDNGESFEVYREFKKKNPVIYNSRKEDISKEFTVDKTKGIDFFTEQTGQKVILSRELLIKIMRMRIKIFH